MIDFTLVGAIENIEVIAANRGIRDLARLNRAFGRGRWRKLKGAAYIKLPAVASDTPKFIGMKRTASEGVI